MHSVSLFFPDLFTISFNRRNRVGAEGIELSFQKMYCFTLPLFFISVVSVIGFFVWLYTNHRGIFRLCWTSQQRTARVKPTNWADRQVVVSDVYSRTLPYKHLVNTTRFLRCNCGRTILVHLQEELSNSYKIYIAITGQFFYWTIEKDAQWKPGELILTGRSKWSLTGRVARRKSYGVLLPHTTMRLSLRTCY